MRRELCAIVQPELVENVVQMHLHGAFGEPELVRDLFVRKRLCDERRDFALPQRWLFHVLDPLVFYRYSVPCSPDARSCSAHVSDGQLDRFDHCAITEPCCVWLTQPELHCEPLLSRPRPFGDLLLCAKHLLVAAKKGPEKPTEQGPDQSRGASRPHRLGSAGRLGARAKQF